MKIDHVNYLLKDAHVLLLKALEELERGEIRNAAEKAWAATLRASNALILAKTQEEPEKTPVTSKKLGELAELDGEIRKLHIIDRYYTRQGSLHGKCFYLGLCEPKEAIEKRIRETEGYIDIIEHFFCKPKRISVASYWQN